MSQVYIYVRASVQEADEVSSQLGPSMKNEYANFEKKFLGIIEKNSKLLKEFSKGQRFLFYKQFDKLNNYLSEAQIIFDGDSANTFDRPKWKILKEKLQKGDKIVVSTLKVFSTSTFRTTLKEIESLRELGVTVYLEDLNLERKDVSQKNILDYVSEIYDYFERIRLERQSAGIALIATNPILRKEKYPGRKSILDPEFFKQVQNLLDKNMTSATALAKELKTSRSTIYKALKLMKQEEKQDANAIADGET